MTESSGKSSTTISRCVKLQLALTLGSHVFSLTYSTAHVRQEDGRLRKKHDWRLSLSVPLAGRQRPLK